MKRSPLQRSTPLRSRSRKKAREDRKWSTTRINVLERDGGRCQYPGCPNAATDVHHRKGRIGSLLHDEEWLISLCRIDHMAVHANPAESYELGLMIKRNTA